MATAIVSEMARAFPPHGRLTIDQLSGDDLLLSAHWTDDAKVNARLSNKETR
jgi:hypothetical protein